MTGFIPEAVMQRFFVWRRSREQSVLTQLECRPIVTTCVVRGCIVSSGSSSRQASRWRRGTRPGSMIARCTAVNRWRMPCPKCRIPCPSAILRPRQMVPAQIPFRGMLRTAARVWDAAAVRRRSRLRLTSQRFGRLYPVWPPPKACGLNRAPHRRCHTRFPLPQRRRWRSSSRAQSHDSESRPPAHSGRLT